ncbi:hypothetical protein Tco_1427322 [Tanacetum coccineum]
MTAPSTSSTNDVNTAKPAYEVSTVSPNVNTASPQDLEQINEDDLKVMDLKWQISLLSIRAKSKKGLGYNVVPPPYPLIYNRPKKLDLSYSGLDEFKEPEFKAYGSEDKQVSKDSSSFVESSLNVDKESFFSVDKKVEFVKPKNHEKPVIKSVRYAEMYRSQTPKGIKEIGMDRSSLQIPSKRKGVNTAKAQAVNTARPKTVKTTRPNYAVVNAVRVNQANAGKPQQDDTGFVDRGCLRHMTGNIAYLLDFKKFDGGYVTFGGGAHGGRISRNT